MKQKTGFIVVFFMLCSTAVTAQVPDAQYDERIKKLEQEINRLQDNMFRTDSLYYTKAYNNGLEGMYVFDKLYGEAEAFRASASQSALLLKLMNVNNPAALELRKRIIAELQQMIESKVSELTGSDTARKRNFFGVIRNIFNNPLVQTAASFIPVGAQVAQVISSISSIVTPKIKIEKNGLGAVKNVLLDVESMLNESPLKEIGNKIMPYLNFYDSLFVMNNEFNREMEYIRSEVAGTRKTIAELVPVMRELTGWKAEQPLNVMIAQFNARYTSPAEIRTKLNELPEQRLKADSLNEAANKVLQQYEQLKHLKMDYEWAFSRFRANYLAMLKKYAAKSDLLKQYLDPLIAELTPPENGDVIASAPLMKFDINLPAATPEQQKKIELLMFKYRQQYDAETEETKKLIF